VAGDDNVELKAHAAHKGTKSCVLGTAVARTPQLHSQGSRQRQMAGEKKCL
jgi:hypothetical protein